MLPALRAARYLTSIVTFSILRGSLVAPLWLLLFAVLGGAILGALGIIAGIWADKFDQLAAFQNFVIMPLTFLSGVFYSIHSLPPFWQAVSRFNPVFYMIDGFRYGFFGVSDVAPQNSLAVVVASFVAVCQTTAPAPAPARRARSAPHPRHPSFSML